MRHRLRRAFSRILCVTVTTYILIVLALMLFETHLVYPGAYLATHLPWQTYELWNTTGTETRSRADCLNVKGARTSSCSCMEIFPRHNDLIHGPNVSAMHLTPPFCWRNIVVMKTTSHQPNRDLLQIAMQRETIFAAHLASRIPTSSSTVVRWVVVVALHWLPTVGRFVLERTYDELSESRAASTWVPVRLVMRNRFGRWTHQSVRRCGNHPRHQRRVDSHRMPRRLHQALKGKENTDRSVRA